MTDYTDEDFVQIANATSMPIRRIKGLPRDQLDKLHGLTTNQADQDEIDAVKSELRTNREILSEMAEERRQNEQARRRTLTNAIQANTNAYDDDTLAEMSLDVLESTAAVAKSTSPGSSLSKPFGIPSSMDANSTNAEQVSKSGGSLAGYKASKADSS